VVTRQLQVDRRAEKVRRPKTDVLPLCHVTNTRYFSTTFWTADGPNANDRQAHLWALPYRSDALFDSLAVSEGVGLQLLRLIITIIKTTSVGDASSVGDRLVGWPVTVGVVEVGVVDTRYGICQPGADAER